MNKNKTKTKILLIILLIISLFFIYFVWHSIKTMNKLWSDLRYKERFIEIEPNELFFDLEQSLQIKMPKNIWDVNTARNYGQRDSSSSCFIIKFSAEPNDVNDFLSKLPGKIDFTRYDKKKDFRYVQASFLAPQWFTETINVGEIGETYNFNKINDFEIYINTSSNHQYIVYLYGFADLPLHDPNSKT